MTRAHDGTSRLHCLVTASQNVGLGINYQSNRLKRSQVLWKHGACF